MLERRLVAEEQRFIGRHRLDDIGHQRAFRRRFESSDKVAKARKTDPARDRKQTAFDQILFVGRQNEAGALFETSAQEFVIQGGHVRSPENSRTTFGAIRSSGSTAEHSPACATERGMPHTTELDSS